MKMKKLFYSLICALLFLSSCEHPHESLYCHKGIYIENQSEIPIKVYKFYFPNEYQNQYYESSICTRKKILNPGDTSYIHFVGRQGCLESGLEWYQTHTDHAPDPSLRTIYICDTNEPEKNYYSTFDSLLLQYNILKTINLMDSSVASLQNKNFIIQYP